MGNRATPNNRESKNYRGFNTVKHSNRDQRRQRQQRSRIVLLSIFLVVIALLLTSLVFLVCSIVDTVKSNSPDTKDPNGGLPSNSGTPSQDVTYISVTQVNDAVYTGELLVVNNNYEYHFPTAVLGLKNIYDNRLKYNDVSNTYMVGDASWKLNSTALDAFNSMLYKYYELSEDGTTLITSAYRTYDDQKNLNSSVAAGYSDHHTGYCVSLKKQTTSGRTELESDHWIYQNCHKYGFIVRYPADKSDITGVRDYTYCLRYVGVAHATYIYEHDLCLEEYVELLKSTYTSANHLKITDANQKTYEVFYVPSAGQVTTIQVPKNYKYTVSGDNIGGFIVTVYLNEPASV